LSLNRYTYVHNNPLNFIDTNGHDYEFYDDLYYTKGFDEIPTAARLHDLFRGSIRELEGLEYPTTYITGAAGILRGMTKNLAVKGSKSVRLLFLSLFAAGGKQEGLKSKTID